MASYGAGTCSASLRGGGAGAWRVSRKSRAAVAAIAGGGWRDLARKDGGGGGWGSGGWWDLAGKDGATRRRGVVIT